MIISKIRRTKKFLARRFKLCAVTIMMKFFGSLFFSYFFSAVDVVTEVAIIAQTLLSTANNTYFKK